MVIKLCLRQWPSAGVWRVSDFMSLVYMIVATFRSDRSTDKRSVYHRPLKTWCRAAVVDGGAGKGGWWDVREESDGNVEWTISKTSSCLFQACSSTSSTVWVPASRASCLHGGTASGRSWNIHRGCEQTWGKLHGKLKGQTMGGGWGRLGDGKFSYQTELFKGWGRLNLETVAWRLPVEISQDLQNTVWWDELSTSREATEFFST